MSFNFDCFNQLGSVCSNRAFSLLLGLMSSPCSQSFLGKQLIRNEAVITRGWLFLIVLTRLTRCKQHRHFGFTNSVHQIRRGRGHCDHWCAGLTSLLQGTRAFDLPPRVERVELNAVMLRVTFGMNSFRFRSCRRFRFCLRRQPFHHIWNGSRRRRSVGKIDPSTNLPGAIIIRPFRMLFCMCKVYPV